MDTPICDFVEKYAQSSPLRLHMPGHKGADFLGVEHLDITEIQGADVLYQAKGIIRQSEENAAALFGSGLTLYSTEGSSLPIRAMLYLCKLYSKGNCTIAAGRNAHKVFITAAALMDIDVQWIYPEKAESMVSCRITPEGLDRFLRKPDQKPAAVYITSPDYLGNLADIRGLADVAHAHGCLLLVDNAHGAYLRFLPESLHPMDLGADLCCDSAHKTLPVLTGGAYLHISKNAPVFLSENAQRALALFASTSPSYLILQSLDRANLYLSEGYREKLEKATVLWDRVRQALSAAGYLLSGNEPLKITVLPKSYGFSGEELAQELEKRNIYVEFADPDHLVMMLSPEWDQAIARQITDAFLSVGRKEPILDSPPALPHSRQVLSPNDTIYRESAEVSLRDSLGCIMASASVSCPPAIPIVSIGERIDEAALRAMDYYGIEKVHIVKP